MADGVQSAESVARRYAVLRPHLNERQRRLLLGVEALQLGRGAIKAIANATGVHPDTIARGVREVEGIPEARVRVRRVGGGRKPLAESDPGLAAELSALVDPQPLGYPTSVLVWTSMSTRHLAAELATSGHPVSDRTVARMLHKMGFSLRADARARDNGQRSDRTGQLGYLGIQVAAHSGAGQPVIRMATKMKELVRDLNAASEPQRLARFERVSLHGFSDKELGEVLPFGIDDASAYDGWMGMRIDQDISAFAVATLRSWWQTIGSVGYPHANRLLICADSDACSGNQVRVWKIELAKLAAETGLTITVSHLPPGTAKWNQIEHRLFSQITLNWQGRPFRTCQVVIDLIRRITKAASPTISCVVDTEQYSTGASAIINDADAKPVAAQDFHSEWNYVVRPVPTT